MRQNIILGGPDGPTQLPYDPTSWIDIDDSKTRRAEFFEQIRGVRFYRHPGVTHEAAYAERRRLFPGPNGHREA